MTGALGTRGSSDSMNVIFRIGRNIVVNYQPNAININTS